MSIGDCTFKVDEHKVSKIKITFDDGEIRYQTGEAADKIWRWYENASRLHILHGAKYDGKILMTKRSKKG